MCGRIVYRFLGISGIFVILFHCAKSGSFFYVQACLPVQCNAMLTLCMCSSSTTMPETTSSEILRKRKTNSFSVMVPSCPWSNLAQRFGHLPTVDWPEPERESRTHRELHSVRDLSASRHRFQLLHILIFVAQQSNTWFTGSSLRHNSFLGQMLASFFTCLRTVRVLFGHSPQTSRGRFSRYRGQCTARSSERCHRVC